MRKELFILTVFIVGCSDIKTEIPTSVNPVQPPEEVQVEVILLTPPPEECNWKKVVHRYPPNPIWSECRGEHQIPVPSYGCWRLKTWDETVFFKNTCTNEISGIIAAEKFEFKRCDPPCRRR